MWSLDEKVEIFNPQIQQWVTGQISYITKKRLCVKYEYAFRHIFENGNDRKYYQWVDHNSKQISKCYVHYNLKSPIYNCLRDNGTIGATPLYYNNTIIISDLKRGFLSYDIDFNKYKLLTEFPSRLYQHLLALDSTNKLLYGFNISCDKICNKFMIFDLTKNKWIQNVIDTNTINMLDINLKPANILFIPSPVNELHLIQANSHSKLVQNDTETCTNGCNYKIVHVADIGIDTNEKISNNKFIYVMSMKKMFLFGTYHVYCCKIENKGETDFIWYKLSVTIPQHVDISNSYYHLILAYDSIAILYFQDHQNKIYNVYCIDLWNEQLFKCCNFSPLAYLNVSTPSTFLIGCNNNIAHFIGTQHYKWSLKHVIPKKLKDRDHLLINGYIKNIVSSDIIKLILTFYSQFFSSI